MAKSTVCVILGTDWELLTCFFLCWGILGTGIIRFFGAEGILLSC